MTDTSTSLVMDKRDRARLSQLMRPFVKEADVHYQGAIPASLANAIACNGSVDVCEASITRYKAHLDAFLEIKRRSQLVRDAFIPAYPLVENNGSNP